MRQPRQLCVRAYDGAHVRLDRRRAVAMPALLQRLTRRLRRGARERDSYRAFHAEVEPKLAARPIVHRFALPPVVGDCALRGPDLAVCIDPAGPGDAAATRASLERQTVRPAAVLDCAAEEALDATRAPWVVMVEAGDRLADYALERLGQAAVLAPDAAVITTDDDRVDRRGTRADPRCAPGPSPDALISSGLGGPPVAVAREAALDTGAAAGPAWAFELLLRLAGPAGSGHAHVPLILVHRASRPDPDSGTLRAAGERALAAWGEPGARVERAAAGARRVRRPVPGDPSVEVIVCFRDRPELLERSAGSLLERTTHERLAVRLVDNASSDPQTARLLERLSGDSRVSVQRDASPFNFAALNNRAASASHADFLVFLNSDTEVIEPEWIEGLLEEAARPEVGSVAPLLLRPDGRVQHAGAAIGLHGWAGHPFAGLAPDRSTAFGTAQDGTRNWLAVTAACLMVERGKWEAVGGFDEGFAVGGNDVDLGLRLTAVGQRSLCVPHVRVVHDESATRDPSAIPPGDFARSRERYGAYRTVGDPFYNPNLTLTDTDCGLRGAAELAP